MLIDSQVHTWSRLSENSRPSPNRDPATLRADGAPYTSEELLRDMDSEGVDCALIYPPGWSAGGLEEALQAVRAAPDRLRLVPSIVPQEGPENHERPREIEAASLGVSRGQARTLHSIENLVGVRVHVGYIGQAPPAMADPDHWCWTELEESGIRVMIAQTGIPDGVEAIVARHPGLRFTIDGLGVSPDLSGSAAADGIRRVIPYAKYSNVAVKACHLPRLSHESFPFRDLHEVLVEVVRAFGPQRVFWGSNVSITRVPYGEGLHMLSEITQLSADDVTWLTGRAISDWLDLA